MAAPGPPRQVKGAVKELRGAMQAALTARRSRLALRLPDGARLGLEKARSSADGAAGFVRGDRELARCTAALFEGTGLKTCVVFPAAGEMRAAIKAFGPLAECSFDCWEEGGSGSSGGGGGAGGKRKRRAGAGGGGGRGSGGFGAQVQSTAAAPLVPGAVMLAGDADVYIVVGPKQSQMARVRALCDTFGDDVLVVLVNGRMEVMQGLPAAVEEYMADRFEDVFYWGMDPSPAFSGGVLFRQYPEDWIVGRATPLGTLQRLSETSERPSVDEITALLREEAEKPATGVLNKVAKFIDNRK